MPQPQPVSDFDLARFLNHVPRRHVRLHGLDGLGKPFDRYWGVEVEIGRFGLSDFEPATVVEVHRDRWTVGTTNHPGLRHRQLHSRADEVENVLMRRFSGRTSDREGVWPSQSRCLRDMDGRQRCAQKTGERSDTHAVRGRMHHLWEGSLRSPTTRRPPFLLCGRNPLSRSRRHLAATALCATFSNALGATASRSGTARSIRSGLLSGFLLLRPPSLLSLRNALSGLRGHLAPASATLSGRRCGHAIRRTASEPLNLRFHSRRQRSEPSPNLRRFLLQPPEFDLHAEAGEVGRVAGNLP